MLLEAIMLQLSRSPVHLTPLTHKQTNKSNRNHRLPLLHIVGYTESSFPAPFHMAMAFGAPLRWVITLLMALVLMASSVLASQDTEACTPGSPSCPAAAAAATSGQARHHAARMQLIRTFMNMYIYKLYVYIDLHVYIHVYMAVSG